MAHGHGHGTHSHDIGDAHADSGDKRRVLVAALLTGIFMVAEAIGGLFTGSLALLADAGHMLTDSVSLALAWYAFHLGGRVGTARMTYGYDRVKTLVAFCNGLTVLLLAAWIAYEAWDRFRKPEAVLGGPMLAIAILGLIVNIAAFLVLNGGDREHLNMRGAILHVLGDLLGSVAAIVAACVILLTGWYPIDPILSVFVALLLVRSAWELVRESGSLLLEGAPSTLDRDAIARDIEASVEGVSEVHHMHVWSMDGVRNMATLHVRLSGEERIFATIAAVKARLAERHGITHATVEPEVGACADEASLVGGRGPAAHQHH
jgi:cobalt-zinc-cadmium efflux system protein